MKNNWKLIGHTLLFWLSSLTMLPLYAQQDQKDNVFLSLEELTALVKQFHPIAREANIQIQQAKADLLGARGAFDPVFAYKNGAKSFDGTRYYSYQQPTLQIPTWFGITLQAGAEELNGSRINNSESTGRSSYWGLQIPLGRDLITDKRRTDLQKAKIARESSYAEKNRMLNDLLLDAHTAYWKWAKEASILDIANESLQLAKKRLQLVKQTVLLGERPAIDTVEALAQVQQFELNLESALLALQNTQWELSQFLWSQDQTPYLLPENCLPARGQFDTQLTTAKSTSIDSLLQYASNRHPELILYNYKLNSLDIQKRYQVQQLLPKAHFQYNFLDKGFQWKMPQSALFQNNYQYGVSIQMPLRLSKERADIQKTKYEIQITALEQSLKKQKIENTIKARFNEMERLSTQIQLQTKNAHNYLSLLRGEEIRLTAGESSLFLVNAREIRYWEARQKLEELKYSYLITLQKMYWAAGSLHL